MQNLKRLLPLVVLFSLVSALVVIFSSSLQAAHFDTTVLLYANIILLIISVISYLIQLKGLNNKNPNVFVRSVMGGMMIKMAICVLAVFFYVYYSGNLFNKRALFASMLLYLVYLTVEVWIVFRMNQRKNA